MNAALFKMRVDSAALAQDVIISLTPAGQTGADETETQPLVE